MMYGTKTRFPREEVNSIEIFDTENAASILNVVSEYLCDQACLGKIEFLGSCRNPQFTWNHLERYISENEEISIFEAQRRIADKVWEEEKVLV